MPDIYLNYATSIGTTGDALKAAAGITAGFDVIVSVLETT